MNEKLTQEEADIEITRLNAAVDEFAAEMKAKLAEKVKEGYSGWNDISSWDYLCTKIQDDARNLNSIIVEFETEPRNTSRPIALANRAMMLWWLLKYRTNEDLDKYTNLVSMHGPEAIGDFGGSINLPENLEEITEDIEDLEVLPPKFEDAFTEFIKTIPRVEDLPSKERDELNAVVGKILSVVSTIHIKHGITAPTYTPEKCIVDTMKCPYCPEGTIAYSIASSNGHIHAGCNRCEFNFIQ